MGRDLWVHHIYPNFDQYSYTAIGNRWCIHSWLADVLFYGLYQLGGRSFFIAFPLLIHTLFSTLVLWAAWRIGSGLIVSGLLGLISAFLVNNLEIRPYLFSELFFLLTYFCFFFSSKQQKYTPYILLFLFILWTNLHGMTLPVSLLFAGSMIIQIFYTQPFRIRSLFQKKYSLLWKCSLFSIAASFIYPTPLELIRRNVSAMNYPTKDWQVISHIYFQSRFYSAILLIYIIIVILYMFLLIQYFRRNKGWGKNLLILSPGEIYLDILCFIAAFYLNRLMFFLAIPIITSAKMAAFLYPRGIQRIEKNKQYYFIIILCATFILCFVKFNHDQWCSQEPVGALAYWKRNALAGNVFTHPLWSGFITWNSSATAKIFSDTRIEPFLKQDWINTNLKIYKDIPNQIPWLRELGTTHVLIPRSYPLLKQMMLNDELTLLYQNPNELLFEIFYPYEFGK